MEIKFKTNFIKLLKNINYETNTDLFIILYKIAFNKNNIQQISSKLLEDETKQEWLTLFNNIKNKIKPIDTSFIDVQKTTFNKFTELYNNIYKLLQTYFKIIENIEMNKYNDVNFLILENNDSVYNIENIYSLIEDTNRTINNKNILLTYHNIMINEQKSKKSKENESKKSKQNEKNKSKYEYALNKSNKFLIKVRRIRLSAEKILNISELFYNLRKVVQILVLLKPTIKYYYNSRNYIVNEDLRSNLLTLIKVLQGSVSRSNKLNTNPSNEEQKKRETDRLNIRSAFKRRLLNTLNNGNNFVYNIHNNNEKESARLFRRKLKNELDFE